MAERIFLISTCILLAISSASSVQTVNGRIKINIGTTAGCGDTVWFIREQLVPTYELYGDVLDLEFVPWGRTVNHGNGNLTCQFLENDCFANRLHRCVLNILQGDQKAQLDYMSCEFTLPRPAFLQGSYACVRAAGVSVVDADYCVNNPNRDTLDQEAEAAAAEPMGIINFVPSIVLNDNINFPDHIQAFQRLSSTVCFALADDPTSGVVSCQI